MQHLLEELTLNAWPAVKVLHYDNWLLRFAGGHTRRANSVNILGPSTLDLEEKIAYCEHAYTAAGQPTIFKFTGDPGVEPLENLLIEKGYQHQALTTIMTLDLQTPPHQGEFQAETDLTQQWLESVAIHTEVPLLRRPHLESILRNIAPAHIFATQYENKMPVAYGMAVAERGWVGLFDIVTAAQARRKGHGQALVRNLLHWGQTQGAQNAYLQVVADNEPAVRLYKGLGFDRRYDYWYRVKNVTTP